MNRFSYVSVRTSQVTPEMTVMLRVTHKKTKSLAISNGIIDSCAPAFMIIHSTYHIWSVILLMHKWLQRGSRKHI